MSAAEKEFDAGGSGAAARAALDDKITSDGFRHEYHPLEERAKQLSDRIPELQGELDFLKIKFLSSDEVLTEAKDLYGRWP